MPHQLPPYTSWSRAGYLAGLLDLDVKLHLLLSALAAGRVPGKGLAELLKGLHTMWSQVQLLCQYPCSTSSAPVNACMLTDCLKIPLPLESPKTHTMTREVA